MAVYAVKTIKTKLIVILSEVDELTFLVCNDPFFSVYLRFCQQLEIPPFVITFYLNFCRDGRKQFEIFFDHIDIQISLNKHKLYIIN